MNKNLKIKKSPKPSAETLYIKVVDFQKEVTNCLFVWGNGLSNWGNKCIVCTVKSFLWASENLSINELYNMAQYKRMLH